jgi:geranylgeranyl diphosphate synthase type 3
MTTNNDKIDAELSKLDLNNNASNVDQKIIANFKKINAKTNEELIMQPYKYNVENSENQFGSELLMTFNHWLKVPADLTKVIQEILEMVHNGCSLINNLDDEPDPEAEEPAHQVYGIPFTINCANYVYFLALVKLINNLPSKINQAVTIFTENLMQLHEGEELQVYWRDMIKCPTMDEYNDMMNKSNVLYALGVKLMQLFSEKTAADQYVKLIQDISKFCRIRQDYLEMKFDPNNEDQSDFCKKLSEGKFSYPIVHAIQSDPDDCYVIQILKLRTKNVDIKKFLAAHVEKQGSVSSTKDCLINLEKEIMDQIEKLGGNPKLETIMKAISMTPKKGKKGNKLF